MGERGRGVLLWESVFVGLRRGEQGRACSRRREAVEACCRDEGKHVCVVCSSRYPCPCLVCRLEVDRGPLAQPEPPQPEPVAQQVRRPLLFGCRLQAAGGVVVV